MNKKVVWLPYDFDTALGINNEGALVFDYALEDIDHLEGGADVFNGQESVVWTNLRDAFPDEIQSMYQTLRSQGKLSYAKVEKQFEDHQDKWSEAIFNEDAWFKYIDPLTEQGNGAYLEMMQGSKKEQRKWWLYNRFRYMDSKYNAGDAVSDVIQLRGYAKADITVTPYADVYPTVKYGSYLVSQRGHRGVATTLVNPLDNVNDTEIYIYSASQLANVGDLSGLLVGFADFSMATKLQALKLGDTTQGYANPNLKTLTLGNNVLLKTIDIRNCTGLGTGDQKAVDISGCIGVENVYFDNTQVTSVSLPNGGVLKVLHLPATVTNLTIMNQSEITEFYMPSFSNISTLRLENVSEVIDIIGILNAIADNSRVRLIGMYVEADDAAEILTIFNRLDRMRGLDEQGNNVATAQVSGEIHTGTLTGAEIAAFNARYPYVNVTADHTVSTLTYKTYDGVDTLFTETIYDGADGTKVNSTARMSTAQYSYTPNGWSLTANGNRDENALINVVANRTVYAAYTATIRTYTVTWKNKDGTTLETDTNVPYGATPSYDGATPTQDGQESNGWNPAVSTVTGDITYTAVYLPTYTATFVRASEDGGGTLYTVSVVEGQTPVYGGTTPTTTKGSATDYPFEGWSPALAPIYANTTYTAQFAGGKEVAEIEDDWATIISKINSGTANYKVGNYKALDLGTEGIVNMQIAALNKDDLAAGGKAKTSWISMELLNTTHRMNPSLETIYKEEPGPSWTFIPISSNYYRWQSNNNGVKNNVAKISMRLTAVTDGTFRIQYSSNQSNTSQVLQTIKINGTTVVSSPVSSYTNYDFAITSGDTYDIEVTHTNVDGSNKSRYGTFNFANTNSRASQAVVDALVSISNIVIDDCTIKSVDHYVDATGAIGGWENSEMRSYLKNTVKPLIPSAVRSAIKEVTKTQLSYNTSGSSETQITTDDVWIPSDSECFGADSLYYVLFENTSANRIKNRNGTASYWWLRRATITENFYAVYTAGGNVSGDSTSSYGVALGFCI